VEPRLRDRQTKRVSLGTDTGQGCREQIGREVDSERRLIRVSGHRGGILVIP
jgi:hypothetical protein